MKYTSDATLGVSLLPEIPKPLDARLVVDSVEELYKIPKNIAYQGMPVVHAGSGSIYILTNKDLIDQDKGWTASYETVLIKMCTESLYKEWLANTKDNKSIDRSLNYIREGVYYYIEEDSIDDKYLFYVSYGQFKTLLDTVSLKASNNSVNALSTSVSTLQKAVDEYSEIKDDYLTKYDLTDEGRINVILANYYLKKDADSIFVKKSDITGDLSDDSFIFVNKKDYEAKIQELEQELNSTLKTNSDGSLDSLKVNTIEDKEGQNKLDISKMSINGDALALAKLLPKVDVVTESQYKELLEGGNLDTSKYYMTYVGDSEDETSNGYMTRDYFEKYYLNADEARIMFDFLRSIDIDGQSLSNILTTLDGKADRSQVYTKLEANDTFQIKGNYITLHLDISQLAEKSEIPKNISLLKNDLNYISKHQSLSEYAKLTDIPDVSLFITKHQDISNLATKDSLPTKLSKLDNDSKFVTMKEVIDYLKNNHSLNSDDIADSVEINKTQHQVNAYIKDNYVTKSEYNQLKSSYESLIEWAKTQGYDI